MPGDNNNNKPPAMPEMKVFIANGDGTYMEGIIESCSRELMAPMRREFMLGDGQAVFSQGRRQLRVSLDAIIVNERVVLADPESATLDLTEGSVARTLMDATAQAVAENLSEMDKRASEIELANLEPPRDPVPDIRGMDKIRDDLYRGLQVAAEFIQPDRSEAVPPAPEPEPEPEPPSDTAMRFGALDMDDD